MNERRRVLVVAHGFPPADRGSVVRVHCFAKYLPEFGWDPTVLTVEERFAYIKGKPQTEMLNELPSAVRIVRTPILAPPTSSHKAARTESTDSVCRADEHETASGRPIPPRAPLTIPDGLRDFLEHLIAFPDVSMWWYPPAVRRGIELIGSERPDVILATAPPFTAHLVAWRLSRRTGVPCVLDVRDEWTGNPLFMDRYVFYKKWLALWLERRMVRHASAVLTTSERASESYRRKLPLGAGNKVHTLLNGFDPDHIHIEPSPTATPPRTIAFCHAGVLSARRDPSAFLEALNSLCAERPELKDRVRVVFIGSLDPAHKNLAEPGRWRFPLEIHDSLPPAEFLAWLRKEAGVGVLFQSADEGGDRAIPGKTYELLALGKVILCMDDGDGATSSLLRQIGTGIICDLHDREGAKRALRDLFDNWPAHVERAQIPTEILSRFDRREHTRHLAEILEKVARSGEPAVP